MRIIPRRAETDLERPFHTPEQLALAMPLVAMIGLMVVVSAVATGGSGPMVALVAVVGFGLCAAAPLALIDVYVTRPLRGALTQIRAARDGRASEAAFASGVVADLVHLARDIHAARAVRGPEHPAEPARAQIVELTEAVNALRAAPAGGFDGAVERLEAMLVYIAESLDRLEAKGGVDRRTADLARLIARETEILQGAVSSGDFSLRADVAGAVAEEQLGRARVLERIDALETRLTARLESEPTGQAAALEAVRAAEAGLAGLGSSLAERVSAQGDAHARRLDEIERRVGDGMAALMLAAKRIGEAAHRLDAERPALAGWERWGDDVRAIAGALDPLRAGLGEAEARMTAGLAQVAARLDAFETRALAPACGALAGATWDFLAAQARIEAAAAKIEAGDPRLAAIAEMTGLVQARLGEVAASVAGADAVALTPVREALADAAQRFEAAQRRLGDAAARIEAGDPRLAETVQKLAALGDLAGLAVRIDPESQVERIAEAVRGLAEAPAAALDALRADFAATASAAAEKFDAAAQDLTRAVEDRVERLRRGELWPAIAAAQATAQDLHKAHAGLFAHVEALKAALMTDRCAFAALRLDVVEALAAVAERAGEDAGRSPWRCVGQQRESSLKLSNPI